jgi:hypothetical protein
VIGSGKAMTGYSDVARKWQPGDEDDWLRTPSSENHLVTISACSGWAICGYPKWVKAGCCRSFETANIS